MLLTEAQLTELERRWRAQGAPAAAHRRPGLPGDELDSITATLGLRLPDEARTWWGWHDGCATPCEIGPDLPLLSLREAVAIYERQRQIAIKAAARNFPRTAASVEGMDDPEYWWRSTWFPITNPSIGCIVVDCSVAPAQPTPIRVIDWAADETFFEPRATSFGAMVDLWLAALDIGVWRYDVTDGSWDYDLERLTDELDDSHLV